MQLEAGKKYTDRRGRIYGPMVQVHDDLFGESAEDYGWYSNGIRSPGKISQGDLVAEYAEPAPVESPDDWVTQDRVPVRVGVDEISWIGDGFCGSSRGGLSYGKMHGHNENGMILKVRCLRKDLPKVESPDDWVIQDRVPAREGIDFGWNVSAKDFDVYVPDDGWKWSIRDPYTGRMHGSYGDTGRLAVFGDTGRLAVFCRRKDLPPVPPVVDPGEGYRLLADDEITLPTDEREYTEGFNDEWRILPEANRRMVGRAVAAIREEWSGIVIRRKLPPATRTIVLKEWICWDDDYPDSVAIAWRSSSPSDGLDSSNFIAFDHAHPTGNTRTVEIPVT